MANWDKIKSKGTIDDRRAAAPVAGGLGLTGVAIMLAITLLSGGDINVIDVANQVQQTRVPQATSIDASDFAGEDDYELFTSKVLGSNNDLWDDVFTKNGRQYTPPKFVLFRQSTSSACGGASSQIGPHYCSSDQTIYIDETFFDELTRRFGAKGGDVAEAYVISHEVGHHVQNLLGASEQVFNAKRANASNANELSISLELQADCYAGLWANSLQPLGIFEPGELNEALDAAAAVGDDRIQEKSTGRVDPESWTHGSSEQRVKWFNQGLNSGNPASCDTFN